MILGAALPIRRALSVVLMTGLLVAAYPPAPASSAEAATVDRVSGSGDLVPPRGALLGSEAPEIGGRAPDLAYHHYAWDERFDGSGPAADLASGRLPFISWDATMLSEVNDGTHDDMIRARAQELRALRLPVFLSWGAEMNVASNPWSGVANTDEGYVNGAWKFVAAWRHVHDIFRAEGAGNVIWVWEPAATSVPSERWNEGPLYYPGDSYVDWIGVRGFDRGGRANRSFEVMFRDAYKDYAHRKPMLVHTGTSDRVPARAHRWIRSMHEALKTDYRQVRALVYSGTSGSQALADLADDEYFAPLSAGARPDARPWVNVKDFGATGDGVTDDTEAFRTALAAGGTKVLVPPGSYVISGQISVSSDTTLWMSRDTKLLAALIDYQGQCLLHLQDAHNVTILGGSLEGRKELNPTGYLYGLCMEGGSTENVYVRGTVARNMPARDASGGNGGDGFYLESGTHVRFEGIEADGNVRQGLSMTGALNDVAVVDSTFSNTSGINPGAGLDIEPNPGAFRTQNVRITGSSFTGNQWGLIVTRWADPEGSMNGIQIENNEISHNRREGLYVTAGKGSPMRGLRIAGNSVHGNGLTGIVVREWALARIVGNDIRHNGGDGFSLMNDRYGTKINRNYVGRNEDVGIRVVDSRPFHITRNKVVLNGEHGIVASAHKKRHCVVRKNRVRNNRVASRH